MQVSYNENVADISNGGILSSRRYRIESMRMVMELLTKKMYNFKLQTMVQEYIANAFDAHRDPSLKESREHIPIKIILPTPLDPHLYVCDSGPGLTEERIDETFVSFGASTKNKSDDDIGGFGLGAKIGLAYSDSFTVISCVDGVKTTYLTFMNKDGCPDMATLSVEQTDTPNGVTIKIAIRSMDFRAARDAVERATYFSSVAPEVVNGVVAHFEESTSASMWYGEVPFSESYNEIYVVVGGIPYQVLPGKVPIINKIKFFGNKTMCLFFDVSEIDVAVNREALDYTSKTIDMITHSLQGIMDANREAIDYASQVPSFEEKVRLLSKCYTRVGAPEKTLIQIQPYLCVEFSYQERFGKLFFLQNPEYSGCKTSIVKVYKRGTVRESVKHNILSSAVAARSISDDNVYIQSKDLAYSHSNVVLGTTIPMGQGIDNYVLLDSNDASAAMIKEKYRIRTLVDHHYSFKMVVTSNKAIYDFLTKIIGFTSVNHVEETLPEKKKRSYSSRSCGFTDVDVKNIYDRQRTINIHDLDPERDMWCLFPERQDAKTEFNKYKDQMFDVYKDLSCYYLTTKQAKYIKKQNKIQHYSVVLKNRVRHIPAMLYGSIQQELISYNTPDDYINAVRSSRGYMVRDHELLLPLYEEYHASFPSEHIIHRLFKHAALAASFNNGKMISFCGKIQQYNILKKGFGKSSRMHEYYCKMNTEITDVCKQLGEEFTITYPLISCVDYSSIKHARRRHKDAMNEVIHHLVRYLNGECV
jgi:hypothetical protein